METEQYIPVSIPYRQAQNAVRINEGVKRVVDSFNSLQVGSKQKEGSMKFSKYVQFQFLIGRLKTTIAFEPAEIIHLFQFLIGRLKTFVMFTACNHSLFCFNSLQVGSKPISLYSDTLFSNCFNSLQVGSKHEPEIVAGINFSFVSIPYRQAQNVFCVSLYKSSFPSFNSLQVGSKRDTILHIWGVPPSFQFLIGRLKT